MDAVLSVVVCTHNNADLLAATLRALPAEVEIVVVDNNCTDHTAAVVEAARAERPELRRIEETRQGQAHARVRGVREARGEWIAFVDDDNVVDPDFIPAALRFIAAHPEACAFGGRVAIDWETPPPPAVERRAWAYAATDLGPVARRLEGPERWKLRGAGLVCRKALLAAAGWLDWQVCVGRVGRGSLGGDDTEILMRVARAGGEIWYEPACGLRHRIAARRIGEAQLTALCRGFAVSDPVLLGLERKGSLGGWAARLTRLLLRRGFALARHGVRAPLNADARVTARLTLVALAGTFRGLDVVWRMSSRQRARWLGDGAPEKTEGNAAAQVLHLHCSDGYGGIQRMLACLGAERARCPAMEPTFGLCVPGRLGRELEAVGARVEPLGRARTTRPWQVARAAWRLAGLVRRERYAAVVCHGSAPLALFAWAVRRARLILWMHNDTKVRNKNLVERLAGWRRPDLVICNSAFTAASLPLLFPGPPPPHTVIACPVSPPAVRSESRAEIRARLDAAPDDAVIALAGRPEPWKGHAMLVDALVRLRDLPGWTLWLIGGAQDSPQHAHLEALAAAAVAGGIAERVRFLGQRDDVADLLAAADIFCQPNLTPEPFGIVFVEALYAGLPVVTGRHGGACEIVDETCGLLVPPGDVAELTAALDQLLRNPALRRRLGAAAPARARAVADPARILPAVYSAIAHA